VSNTEALRSEATTVYDTAAPQVALTASSESSPYGDDGGGAFTVTVASVTVSHTYTFTAASTLTAAPAVAATDRAANENSATFRVMRDAAPRLQRRGVHPRHVGRRCWVCWYCRGFRWRSGWAWRG